MQHVIRRIMLVSALAISGCASYPKQGYNEFGSALGRSASVKSPSAGRMIAWRSSMTLQVWNVSNAVNAAVAMTEKLNGIVEQKSDGGEQSASITLRIPVASFQSSVSEIESLGEVTFRSVSSEDVTEQFIDTDTRLKNNIMLRDRLKALLDRAESVQDIVAIETELNRVQSDIESMEAVVKSLKGQVDMATLYLQFERKPVLGPLGYLFKGLWWGVEKLFVIRD